MFIHSGPYMVVSSNTLLSVNAGNISWLYQNDVNRLFTPISITSDFLPSDSRLFAFTEPIRYPASSIRARPVSRKSVGSLSISIPDEIMARNNFV